MTKLIFANLFAALFVVQGCARRPQILDSRVFPVFSGSVHFHLVDANSPLGAEGIPYELESFTQLGVVGEDPALPDSGQILLPKTESKPVVHRREFPIDNAAVTFP